MSIKKTVNGWQVKVRIRLNGRIVTKQKTSSGTKEEAKGLFERLKKELRNGLDITTDENPILEELEQSEACSLSVQSIDDLSTFAELLTFYKSKNGPFSESHTQKIDALSSEIGGIPLSVFPEKFERYYQLLKVRINPKTKKPLSNRAINRKTEIVKAAFKLLEDLELIEKSPISNTRVKKLKEIPRDVILSEDQQQKLIAAVKANYPHIEYLVRFALQVPCRRSELVNMRKNDLDLFNNVIRIRNGNTKNDCGVWKPIPPDLIDYFRNIPKESEFVFYRVVNGSRNDRTGDNKKYLPLGDFKKAWKGALKEAGLSDIGLHVHDLRHVSATALVDNGTPEQVVMQVAGWKTNMLQVYYNRNPKKALSLIQFNTSKESLKHSENKDTVNAV